MPTSATIQKISFIGSGNVAVALAVEMKNKGLRIVEVYSPNRAHAERFAWLTGCAVVDDLKKISATSDLYLLAVPDDAVKKVCQLLMPCQGIVAHTSGITSIEALSAAVNYGVFYPLQTFTIGRQVDFHRVPFCIEGNNRQVTLALSELALKLSNNISIVSPEQRKSLHLAAVFVSNFSNHLYFIAGQLLADQGLSFDLLKPLINETAAKVNTLPPSSAQTGPARRNDRDTLSEHLKMLENHPDYKMLYKMISEQITKRYDE